MVGSNNLPVPEHDTLLAGRYWSLLSATFFYKVSGNATYQVCRFGKSIRLQIKRDDRGDLLIWQGGHSPQLPMSKIAEAGMGGL